jgi:uncharacterized membrane protein YfcA
VGIESDGVELAGALAGGFVNGLTGFGTGLTAIGIWLHVLPAPVAASLVVVTSVIAQIQNLPLIWGRVDWQRSLPFIAPALIGVPVGTAILALADAGQLKLGVGLFLVVYAALALASGPQLHWSGGGRTADAAVGLTAGVLGGLAGLSGALMAMWGDLRGGSKEARRTLTQVFNLSVLAAALGGHAVGGYLTREVWISVLAALPGTLAGAAIGAAVYRQLGDRGYRRIVLVLLLASGLALVVAAAGGAPARSVTMETGTVHFVALASVVRTL